MLLLASCFICLRSSAQSNQKIAPVQQVKLTSDTIYWEIPELNLGRMMRFSKLDSVGVFNNDVEKGQSFTFKMSTAGWTQEFKSSNTQKLVYPLAISKDGASKKLTLIFWPDLSSAIFDDTYRKANNTRISIEIPEVYELCYTAFSIAAMNRAPGSLQLANNTDYYKELVGRFAAQKDHPLITAVQTAISENGNAAFYSLCMDSYSYSFNNQSKLQKSATYTALGSRVKLADNLAMWEDFAAVSGFREFYQSKKNAYQQVADETKKNLSFETGWSWLEKNFSHRVNDYKVVLSPLAGSFYRTNDLLHNGYTEMIFFGNAFDKSSYKNISENAAHLLYQSGYFIAACKNYLIKANTSFKKDAQDKFGDFDVWADAGKEAFNFPGGYELFMEYLSQSCFLLYVKEAFKDEYSTIKFFRDRFMKQRGFKNFDQFLSTLESVYDKSPTRKIEDCIQGLFAGLKP